MPSQSKRKKFVPFQPRLMWQGTDDIEGAKIKDKLLFWLPVNYCRRCGHWCNMGRKGLRCSACNNPKTVLIKNEKELRRIRMYIIDQGGLI